MRMSFCSPVLNQKLQTIVEKRDFCPPVIMVSNDSSGFHAAAKIPDSKVPSTSA